MTVSWGGSLRRGGFRVCPHLRQVGDEIVSDGDEAGHLEVDEAGLDVAGDVRPADRPRAARDDILQEQAVERYLTTVSDGRSA